MQYTFKPKETISTISFAPMSATGVREWLETLPRVNVGELSKQLYMALQQLSVLETKPALMAGMLDEAMPHVEHTAQLLMQKFLLGGRRDALQAQKAINLIHHFSRLMFRAAHSHRVGKMKAHNISLIGIELKALQLDLAAYQMSYMDVSSDYWQTFNTLLSECIERDYTTIETRHGRVVDLLKASMLLATAQTNQMLARDIYALTKVLPAWAGETYLQENNNGILCFPGTEKAPIANHKLNNTDTAAVSIDTRRLANKLSDAISQVDSDFPQPETGGMALIVHVIKAWSGSLARHMQRSKINHSTRCVLGLAAVHQSLDTGGDLQTSFVSDYKVAPDRIEERDVWSEAYSSKAFDSIELPEQHNYRPPMLTPLQITDLSPGGYGIKCSEPPSIMQTGELIGIEQRNQQLHIGLVRWLKQSGSSLQAGIELVAPKSEPCIVRILHSSGRHSEPQRGLFVVRPSKQGQQQCLILPSVPFKAGDHIQVDLPKKASLSVKLDSKIMSSVRVSVFTIKEQKEFEPPQKKAKVEDDSFESLFSIS